MSRSIPEELMELKKVLDTAFPTADNLNLDLFISRSIECGKDPSFLRGLQDLFSFLTREKEFLNPIEIDLVYQLRKNIIATPNMDYIRFKEPVRKAVANRRKEDIRAINDILTATMSYPADQENHVRLKELQCTLQDASATAYAWYDYTLSGKIDHALYNMQNLNQKKVQTFNQKEGGLPVDTSLSEQISYPESWQYKRKRDILSFSAQKILSCYILDNQRYQGADKICVGSGNPGSDIRAIPLYGWSERLR